MPRPLTHAVVRQGAGSAFNALVSFGLMLFLAREMGAAVFGQYAVVLSVALLGLILIEGGWPTLLYRETATTSTLTESSTHAGLAVTHVISISVGSALLAGALAPSNQVWSAALACMGSVALMNLVSGRLRGAGQFGIEALWQSSGRIASAILIVAAVLWFGPSPTVVFLAWATGLSLLLLTWGRGRLGRPARPAAAAYRLALPLMAFEGLLALLTKADMAVLGISPLSARALSDYAACTRINEAALLLFAPVVNVLLRGMRLARNDDEPFRHLLTQVLAAAASLGAAMWLFAWLAGTWLMRLLFGPEFASAGALLPWTLAALPATLGNLVLFQAALARDEERRLVWRMVVGAVLLLTGLLVGSYLKGMQGAAMGALLAQSILFLACFPLAWSRTTRRA